MKKLLLLTGVFLALITMIASNNLARAGRPSGACTAPIIVSN
jgi:ATP/ADP translocase